MIIGYYTTDYGPIYQWFIGVIVWVDISSLIGVGNMYTIFSKTSSICICFRFILSNCVGFWIGHGSWFYNAPLRKNVFDLPVFISTAKLCLLILNAYGWTIGCTSNCTSTTPFLESLWNRSILGRWWERVYGWRMQWELVKSARYHGISLLYLKDWIIMACPFLFLAW